MKLNNTLVGEQVGDSCPPVLTEEHAKIRDFGESWNEEQRIKSLPTAEDLV